VDLHAHPYADLFPMMTGEAAWAFERDIIENGLRNPKITLHPDGRILDGRNRYQVCKKHGIAIVHTTFEGDDAGALRFVVSANLARRHLTESQRAAIAAEIATLKHGGDRKSEQAKNQVANLQLDQAVGVTGLESVTREQAADMMNVSKRTVDDAAEVKRDASPETWAQVKAGEVSVHAAKQQTRREKGKGSESKPKRAKTAAQVEKAVEARPEKFAARYGALLKYCKELKPLAIDLRKGCFCADYKFSKIEIQAISRRLDTIIENLATLFNKE